MNKIIYGAMSLFPVLALAQNNAAGSLGKVEELVRAAGRILQLLIPMAFALAIIYFFYGVAKYIGNASDPKSKDEGKSIMIGGIIGIAVMASVYGLVAYLQNSIGITNNPTTITVPTVTITP
ncbi:MAG: hypothetical protein NTV02_02290 [Candidatus Zambryskibacteria bacterium]|nr:hypothetical protein [Candidatus Zambryskibacteria bacterium]